MPSGPESPILRLRVKTKSKVCVCLRVSEACVLGAVVCATRLTTTSSINVLRDFLSFFFA